MFLKLLEKYRNRRQIKMMKAIIADYGMWRRERKLLLEDAQKSLEFIDSLPQGKDTKFCKKWLNEIVETLNHPQMYQHQS